MDTSRSSRSGREGERIRQLEGGATSEPQKWQARLAHLFQPQLSGIMLCVRSSRDLGNYIQAEHRGSPPRAYVGEYADFADYVRQTR